VQTPSASWRRPASMAWAPSLAALRLLRCSPGAFQDAGLPLTHRPCHGFTCLSGCTTAVAPDLNVAATRPGQR
jgi:hypothetical protein